MQQEPRQHHGSSARQKQDHQNSTLTAKLSAQSDRILKWKMQCEMELKKRDDKLKEYESKLQKQHHNLLNQQMQSEKLSQRLQAEFLVRGEVKGKVENTRQICTILQQHCNQLSETLRRGLEEKTILKTVYDDQSKEVDVLANKVTDLQEKYSCDVEFLKAMVEEERRGRAQNVTDAKLLKATLEQRAEVLAAALRKEKENVARHEAHLAESNEIIKNLKKNGDILSQQINKTNDELLETKTKLESEKKQLAEQLEAMQKCLVLENEKMKAEILERERIFENLQGMVQLREDALYDNKLKGEAIDVLTAKLAEKDMELNTREQQLDAETQQKEELQARVSELEQLRAEFTSLQESLERTLQEKEEDARQLQGTMEKLQQLHTAVEMNGQLLEKYELERSVMIQQVGKLGAEKEQLNNELSNWQLAATSKNEEIKQLNCDLEDKRLEVENMQSNLNCLESEKKMHEKEMEALKQEVSNFQQLVSTLKENEETLSLKCSRLEMEMKEMQGSLAGEGERSSCLTSQLARQEQMLLEAQACLAEKNEQMSKASELLHTATTTNEQLEARTEMLLQDVAKLSEEKNECLLKIACSIKDNQILESKLQEEKLEFQKHKNECSEISQQNSERLEQEVMILKDEKGSLEEKLSLTEKQLTDTIQKLREVADKSEAKKKRLQDKVGFLEKKLRLRDQEVKELRLYKADSPIKTRVNTGTGGGVPTTPKVLSAEPARGILKTPTTPQCRKRVMFQNEESSDTDASIADIMVIDEREVQRRLEAFKRGEKGSMNAPLLVVKSPNKPAATRRATNSPKADAAPAHKKKRTGALESNTMENSSQPKSKVFIDGFENAFGFDD